MKNQILLVCKDVPLWGISLCYIVINLYIYIYIYIYFELYIYNSNLTKEERQAIYSLRDDTSIIIKEADKGSGIVVWDREDYLAEARTQLKDKYLYQELKGNIVGPLEKIIKSVLRKVRNRKDISDETLDYFLVNNPKFARFYFQRYTKGSVMYHVDQLYLILYITLKICQLFSIIILNRLHKKLNHILRTPMTFYVN